MYFPKIDTRFDNDNRGGLAYRTLAIHDLDGSTTGIPNSYVLLNDGENDSVATDSTCKIQPTWNASVCTGDVGRLNMGRGGGGPAAWRCAPSRWCRSLVPQALVQAEAQTLALGPAQQLAAGCRQRLRGPEQPIALAAMARNFTSRATRARVRAGTEIRVKTERPKSLSA